MMWIMNKSLKILLSLTYPLLVLISTPFAFLYFGPLFGFIYFVVLSMIGAKVLADFFGIPAKCPFCGADIKYLKSEKSKKCPACHNRYIIRNAQPYTPEQAKSIPEPKVKSFQITGSPF